MTQAPHYGGKGFDGVLIYSVAGILIPKYAKDAPHPVQHLNPFASLCLVNALHHHIWEFRSQLSVYLSLGVTVPFWAREDITQPKGIENGFEGRKVVRPVLHGLSREGLRLSVVRRCA